MMGDVNLALVIITAIIYFLFLAIDFYHLLSYQHPDDVNQTYFSKTAGLIVTAIFFLMLPADVDNHRDCRHDLYNGACNLTQPMETLWLTVYIIDTVLVFPVILFAMFYYEGIMIKVSLSASAAPFCGSSIHSSSALSSLAFYKGAWQPSLNISTVLIKHWFTIE